MRVRGNQSEYACEREIRAQGLGHTKRGWPDYSCWDSSGNLVMVVEVKPNGLKPLRREQLAVMTALKKAGINVMRWAPDTGFVEFIPDPS